MHIRKILFMRAFSSLRPVCVRWIRGKNSDARIANNGRNGDLCRAFLLHAVKCIAAKDKGNHSHNLIARINQRTSHNPSQCYIRQKSNIQYFINLKLCREWVLCIQFMQRTHAKLPDPSTRWFASLGLNHELRRYFNNIENHCSRLPTICYLCNASQRRSPCGGD